MCESIFKNQFKGILSVVNYTLAPGKAIKLKLTKGTKEFNLKLHYDCIAHWFTQKKKSATYISFLPPLITKRLLSVKNNVES